MFSDKHKSMRGGLSRIRGIEYRIPLHDYDIVMYVPDLVDRGLGEALSTIFRWIHHRRWGNPESS